MRVLTACIAGLLLAVAQAQITFRHKDIAAIYGSAQPEAATAFAELVYPLPQTSYAVLGGKPVEQVHVHYQSSTEVIIAWVTGRPTITNLTNAPTVTVPRNGKAELKWGTSSSKLSQSAKGSSSYYVQDYFFNPALNISGLTDAQFNYTSASLHSVRLGGLTPGARYYYCLSGETKARSFKLPPALGKFPFRLGSFADVGLSLNATETIRKMKLAQPDLAVLVGDFAYANLFNFLGKIDYLNTVYKGLTYSDQRRWDTLGRMLEGLYQSTPMLSVQGNHEMEMQLDGSMFKSWFYRFGRNAPFAKSGGSPHYYSANVGPVHILALSPYVDFVKGSAQYDWLVRDLSSIDRSVTPWVVAMFHAPWYHTFVSHFKELECHRLAVEPLLFKYGVNVALAGHVHAYERTNPVYNYQLNKCGTVHVTAGNAGVGLNTDLADSEQLTKYASASSYNATTNCTNPLASTGGTLVYVASGGRMCVTPDNKETGKYCPDTQPAWSARREAAHGFVTIDFVSATSATLKYYRNLEADGQPTETVALTRDLTCPNQAMKDRSHSRALRAEHVLL